MSVLNSVSAPVIQMGLVEKIVEAQQNQPVVQQSVARESAKQALAEARSRVAVLDETEDGHKVRDKQSEQDKGGRRGSPRKKKIRASLVPVGDDPTEKTPATKAWSGHILNIKI